MAANLKSLLDQQLLGDVLAPFTHIVGDFLQNRYPGSERPGSASWKTYHDNRPFPLDPPTFDALLSWAKSNHIRPFTRHLFICTKLRRGNVIYQPCKESLGNGSILFQPRGTTSPIPGRIDLILQEPDDAIAVFAQPRIILLVRAFAPLNTADEAQDPYGNHPLVSRARFGIMGLFYNAIDNRTAYIIEPGDIVSHVSVTTFNDPGRRMSAPCIVVLDLDLVSISAQGR